jgi:membrane-associated protein
MHFDAKMFEIWIQSLGFWGGHIVIWAIVFAESGLFFGFFLPGDSLLVTSGVLASAGKLDIFLLAGGCFVCAVLGDTVGYFSGKWFGGKLLTMKDHWWFKRKHLASAQKFYDKNGKKTIVLARFMPIVRTFAPIVAGMADMNYRYFLTFNIIGGFGWTVGLTCLGYFLGNMIPDVDKYLLPIILVIIVVSLLPSIWHIYQENKTPS